MPFIVATYVYASSQGQQTHSARTNFINFLGKLVVNLEPPFKNQSLKNTPLLTDVWLISNTLSSIWGDRKDKKKPGLHRTRSSLEAKVNILRKSRFSNAAQIIQNFDGLSINM